MTTKLNFEEMYDDVLSELAEAQRALVLLANQLETHSVPFVPAAEVATFRARRAVEQDDRLLARGMEAATQAFHEARARRNLR